MIEQEKFCSWVDKMHEGRTRALCHATNGQLWHMDTQLASGTFCLHSSSISLATLLDRRCLINPQQKAIMSYLLVKSVCDFYESEWMTKKWNKYSIQFMFRTTVSCPKRETQHALPFAVYISEPFIEADFESIPPTEHEAPRSPSLSHRYPKLLALGIMLLEIELGEHIIPRRRQEAEPFQNADHATAVEVLTEEEWKENKHGGFKCIRDIIEVCIKPDIKVLGNAPDRLYTILQQKIVRPCRNLFDTSWNENPDMFKSFLNIFHTAHHNTRQTLTSSQLSAAVPMHSTHNSQEPQVLSAPASRSVSPNCASGDCYRLGKDRTMSLFQFHCLIRFHASALIKYTHT